MADGARDVDVDEDVVGAAVANIMFSLAILRWCDVRRPPT